MPQECGIIASKWGATVPVGSHRDSLQFYGEQNSEAGSRTGALVGRRGEQACATAWNKQCIESDLLTSVPREMRGFSLPPDAALLVPSSGTLSHTADKHGRPCAQLFELTR